MTPQEAIEILRGTKSPPSVLHPQIAADMGADAIEFLEWLDGDITNWDGYSRIAWLHKRWKGENSFIEYAQSEWEKERKA